jgi:hypothetical protein
MCSYDQHYMEIIGHFHTYVCTYLFFCLFTLYTFHRSMKERKPVGYRTCQENAYTFQVLDACEEALGAY